jgi:hypothetical protein
MSINTIVAGALAVAGLGGATVFAATNPTIQADYTKVQTAIVNKDLTSYKTAKTQLINDKTTAETTKINATTQDQLNTMSDKLAKITAVQAAITVNDYNAFKAAADANMLARTPDQASFDKLVANQKAHADEIAKISEAIKNNDFNAFKAAEATMVANRPTDNNRKNDSRPAPTDAQLQTRFDKMVADYKANGTLPSDNKGMMGRGGMDDFGGEGFGGGRGHRGGFGNNSISTTPATTSTSVIK